MHRTITKPQHGSAEWLAVRHRDEQGRARISASAAAAVHNQHKYISSGALATELLCDEPPAPLEANDAMKSGVKLEPLVREWASDLLSIPLFEPDEMFVYESDDEQVRLIATLDAVDVSGTPYEIKTIRRKWDGKMPEYWYWQGVQQAICTNSNVVQWIIFDSSLSVHFHDQVVTSDEKQIHIEACREFLKAIDNGVYPPTVHYAYEDVSKRFSTSDGSAIDLDEAAEAMVLELKQIEEEAEALDKQHEQLKAQICEMLGTAETGKLPNGMTVSWRQYSRKGFDTKKFEADHPALAEKYKKQSVYRSFRINA